MNVNKGCKPFDLFFTKQSFIVEVNERFVIYDDYNALLINVGAQIFVITYDFFSNSQL